MIIRNEADVRRVVEVDSWMMDVLRAAEGLNLEEWWIGAGFLRNKIWDAMEDNETAESRDVDLVYFDKDNVRPETDWAHDVYMKKRYPFAEWEVRNQARMHYKNNFEPYSTTEEGISNWVETATCIAVKIEDGRLRFLWCHGMDDVLGLIARPIKRFQTPELLPVFFERIAKKGWPQRWPHLVVKEE